MAFEISEINGESMIKQKHICRCGNTVENLTSYFHKVEGMRVTVCDKCAERYGLTDTNVYSREEYKNLKEEQKKTPDAINN